MPRKAKTIEASDTAREGLERLSKSQKSEWRMVRRAQIVLGCLAGKRLIDISEELNEEVDIIIKWRTRFEEGGIEGLRDAQRSGKPPKYDDVWKKMVLAKLDEKPPDGLARWDTPTLAKELQTSEDAVQRYLQKQGIQLARMRSWCVSTDPEFAAKAVDIVGLYLNPPENAVVLSVDEKPSIQALSRTTGVVKTNDGKIVSAVKSTYKRNGTQNLFSALEVATGIVHGKTTKTKKRPEFLAFMDDVLKELPQDDKLEYHVILDNYCIHKRCDDWLEKHKNVHFHFTPTNASWLNQVEIWFNIMSRKVLRGASFNSVDALSSAIASYIEAYNETSHPFIWKKRLVRGSQIQDKLSNLCG